jgi:hypothetical protein
VVGGLSYGDAQPIPLYEGVGKAEPEEFIFLLG